MRNNANPVDRAWARSHFRRDVGNQLVQRGGVEAFVTGTHFEPGLDYQDHPAVAAIDFPFMPAAAQLASVFILQRAGSYQGQVRGAAGVRSTSPRTIFDLSFLRIFSAPSVLEVTRRTPPD